MLSVAVIGCGNWGQNYVRNFSEMSGVHLHRCCDASQDHLKVIKQRYPSTRVSRGISDVVNDPSIDAVVVATPARTHFTVAKQCLRAGKHVLVEKPFTLSSDEALELGQIAAELERVVMVGHILNYHPALVKLKDYIDSGELGQIYYVYANRTNLGLVRDDVSVMWDLAPHDIATFMYLLGEMPTHISMRGQAFINEGIEDVTFLTLRFANDVIANIHVSWLDPCKVRRTTIIGERKMVVFDDAATSEKIKIYNKGVNRRNGTDAPDSFADFQYTFSYGDVYIPKIEMMEPLRLECEHFVQCIADGVQPRTDAQNGYEVVRILERAEQSRQQEARFVPIDEMCDDDSIASSGIVERARSLWRELRLVKG